MPIAQETIVLVGLESVGKSALFRQLSGEATGDETNFRGSTVQVRTGAMAAGGRIVDTPGIRLHSDSATTRLALQSLEQAETVLLVARGTHANVEIDSLLHQLGHTLAGRKTALAITFADRAPVGLQAAATHYAVNLGIPVALVNARNMSTTQWTQLLDAIGQAAPLHRQQISLLPEIPLVQPQSTPFEHRLFGPLLALLAMALIFALPVYVAYRFADWLQPLVDAAVITPLVEALAPLAATAPLLHAILAGNYGLLTLGWYSFLWAFPVVLLIGASVAVTDETGLKDRITTALDPWLRQIGLNGRDLAPVLSGFGCNVVAVFQSRTCSSCTRKNCVSLIAFGSACSYQIGASLSLFGSAHTPWLFAPYLALLFVIGALHTRLWQGELAASTALLLNERAFIQAPTWRGLWWRLRSVLRQFLREAMPIFLAICSVAALLEYAGIMEQAAQGIAPFMSLFGLPGAVAPGVLFAVIRKDGLLVLNQGDGALLASLSAGQVLVLVYLASTLTACLVTLWTVRKELGWRYALTLAGRQAATSLVSAWLLAQII